MPDMNRSHLPISINDLLNPNVVESDRVEFKEGWNPDPIIRTLCAFANDFHDYGGGYIVIGVVDTEGQPQLPPVGVQDNQVDSIQHDLLQYCHLIQPHYFPHFSLEEMQGQRVIVLWAPGGQNRPYKAPDHVTATARERHYHYYIRQYSNTVKVNAEQERELIGLTATVPFDDRINQGADVNDIRLPLIQEFLREIGSSLHADSGRMPFEELCRNMEILDGGPEYPKPLNVGLMFFSDNPEQFFPGTRIELVEFRGGVDSGEMDETILRGPLQRQIRDALNHLKNNVLKTRTKKHPNRAEAEQIVNYPYAAIEESLVNAVYHRGYDVNEPVEVRINPDSIEILSYPGPVPSVDMRQLRRDRVIARRYRNRRVGNFLKELKLTEGRGTGIPGIRRSMRENGSEPPQFETDKERSYFLVRLPIHTDWEEIEVQVKVYAEVYRSLNETEKKLLEMLCSEPLKTSEIAESLGYKRLTGNLRKALNRLENIDLVALTIPDKPRSQNQKRKITMKGFQVIEAGESAQEEGKEKS